MAAGACGPKFVPCPETPGEIPAAPCVPDQSTVPIFHTDGGLAFVRTPDEQFDSLDGFPFEAKFVEIEGLLMHYVDEGPADGQVVLMLHGQPSWSYLYRKMIPLIAAAGHRAIAVDTIGMGRSDKPVDLCAHTYDQHVDWHWQFIQTLGLENITLFCQDWGGFIGLRIAGLHPERFARIVAANTALPIVPKGLNPLFVPIPVTINCRLGDFEPFIVFQDWLNYTLTAANFRASQVVEAFTLSALSQAEAAAYDAPYPSLIYKAAIRMLPAMVAAIEDQNQAAWDALGNFHKPFLTLAGDRDPGLGSEAGQNTLINHIPGAAGQPHERFNAHHFIQEDLGETLAARVNDFIAANPLPASSFEISNEQKENILWNIGQ